MEHHQTVEYINNLQLATPQELYGNDITPPGSAAVISGAIVVFDPNCKPQDENDIKDAFCFAQLVAFTKFPGNDQVIEYFNEMKTILSNIGFMNVNFEWNDINTSAQDFIVEQKLFELLKVTLAPEALSLVEKTLAALKRQKDGGKPAWQIFSRGSRSDTNAKFVLGVGEPDKNNTKLTMIIFQLKADQVPENFLWDKWTSQNLQVQSAKVQFILSSELYAEKFRAAVQSKLGIQRKVFTNELDI